ncbi:MAG: polyhydroxybutyrate depolymerase [Ascidiaceihabitans sp.]|jgi:polyhydroxybutyrate depolymerase
MAHPVQPIHFESPFMKRRLFATLFALTLSTTFASAQDCGDADTPCVIDGGTYHAIAPNTEPKGIVIFLHGGGGRGKSLLKSGMAKAAVKRGYVYVAPDGYHPNSRFIRNWSVKANNSVFERDDVEFLTTVLADVRKRFNITATPTLLSGFSRGGSMVWDVACQMPNFATAYAPIAGAFWDDLPTACAAPVKLFHTHGWTDRTVPLEGRSFGGGAVIQGDVWASLKVLRETNGCDKRQPEKNSFDGDMWFRHWTDCSGADIELMLHKGGHGVPKGWSARTLDWFEE